MQPTPPGWYWDPGNRPGLFRWWDGHGWAEQLTANRHEAPPPESPLPRPAADGRYHAGGLSFPVLPEPWHASPGYPDIDEVAAQEVMVGKTPRGPYVGGVFIGGLPGSYGYRGPDDLDRAGRAFADAMLTTYYPHERPDGAPHPEPWEVGDRPAWRLLLGLDVDDPSLDLTHEQAVFVVVDRRDDGAAVCYASLPEDVLDAMITGDHVCAELRADP